MYLHTKSKQCDCHMCSLTNAKITQKPRSSQCGSQALTKFSATQTKVQRTESGPLILFLPTAPASFIELPGLPTSEASETLLDAQLMLTKPTSSNVFMSLEDAALSTLFPICWATSATLGHHRSSRSSKFSQKTVEMRARYPKPVLAAFGKACGGAAALKWHLDGHAQLQKGLDRCSQGAINPSVVEKSPLL